MSHSTLLNLRHVTHTFTWWDNGRGVQCKKIPPTPTANGCLIVPNFRAYPHPLFPNETELERAKRLGILDQWTFVVEFILHKGHKLTFKGEKAQELYNIYKGVVYNRSKKK